MFWVPVVILMIISALIFIAAPIALIAFGVNAVKKRLQGSNGSSNGTTPSTLPPIIGPVAQRRGCPASERNTLRKMERRLTSAHQSCVAALDSRFPSELARARVAPPLEAAYEQIRSEIESIYAFCERTNLAGTLKKANTATAARDIYLEAYQRDLAKVQEAIAKTEECLAAYERTVATLEVSSVETSIDSDFDAAISMLEDLRRELPRYNLEDRI